MPKHHSPAELWHLLSLDAPSVAALWTAFIARCAGITLPWTSIAAMFLAVWMLYAADRLLDARPLPDGSVPSALEERHRFHHRHGQRFLLGIGIASVALAALLGRLDPHALQLYALLASLLSAWLLLVHTRSAASHQHRRLPKELAVGVFFPAAVFIPTVARLPELRLALLPVAGLLAAVCTLNCLFLYAWEHPAEREDHHPPRLSTAHATTRWAVRHLAPMAAFIPALALGLAWATRASALSPPTLACGISSLLLLALHRVHHRLKPLTLRVLADAVLLTPVLGWLPPLLRLPGHR